jgi:hypothetical protein
MYVYMRNSHDLMMKVCVYVYIFAYKFTFVHAYA